MNASYELALLPHPEASRIVSEPAIGFLVPRTRLSTPALAANIREVVKGMISVIDEIVGQALSARTRAEFADARIEAFRKYAPVSIALSQFARSVMEPAKAELICSQVLSQTGEDFRLRGPAAFGKDATRQVRFTISIFGKTNAMVSRIALHLDVFDELRARDTAIARQFTASGLWATFSLDCLKKALRENIQLPPAIVEEHIEGMRSAVNAYAHAREAFSMRFPRVIQPAEIARDWDEEDEALMSAPPQPIPAGL